MHDCNDQSVNLGVRLENREVCHENQIRRAADREVYPGNYEVAVAGPPLGGPESRHSEPSTPHGKCVHMRDFGSFG